MRLPIVLERRQGRLPARAQMVMEWRSNCMSVRTSFAGVVDVEEREECPHVALEGVAEKLERHHAQKSEVSLKKQEEEEEGKGQGIGGEGLGNQTESLSVYLNRGGQQGGSRQRAPLTRRSLCRPACARRSGR